MTPLVRSVQVSHEAHLLKSLAADAVEDGVHAAQRTIRSVQRRIEELGDLRDEAACRVKRQPFKALGIAVGVGLVFGLSVSWLGGRPLRNHLSEPGVGQVSEVFDGDPPHQPRGCIAQAWSVAELLRIAVA